MRNEYVYRERQTAWPVLVVLTICLGIIFWAFRSVESAFDRWSVLGAAALVAGALLCLGCMTTEVGGGELRWGFGWLPWPRWRISLSEIDRIEKCRTRWTDGWGIQHTREGWLYSIAGFDALRVVRRDGQCFRLGSADLAGLYRSLDERL